MTPMCPLVICRSSRRSLVVVASGGGKVDITKVGLNSIEEGVVKQNLMGKSRYMSKKGWVDAQGRKGKVRVGLGSVSVGQRQDPQPLSPPAQQRAWATQCPRHSCFRSPCNRLPVPRHALLTLPLWRAAPHPQGYGVYKYADKYGANVDGYSPIYTPDLWTESGDTYKLGTKGLLAW